MPWEPFFQKVNQADKFVLLGHVQFEKNNFQNRFQYDGNWQTLRVNKGVCEIKTKEYIDARTDWETIKRKVPKHSSTLSVFDQFVGDNLWATNSSIIREMIGILGIEVQIEEDFKTQLSGTARLVEICSKFGAVKYLSGPSGRNYLDLNLFHDAGIEVDFFEPAPTEFPHILDRLKHCL